MVGHKVTRSLSEPSDQTIMHTALRALLRRGGSKSVRIDNRYTKTYGPREVILKIDGRNIYRKTMITCDEDLAGQVFIAREELRVRSIGHCALLEENAMHQGKEADVSAHVLDLSGEKKTQLRGLLDTGAVLSVIPIETWKNIRQKRLDILQNTAVSGKQKGVTGSK